MSLFVTGTDTDVGKTWIASRLVAAARAGGVNCVGMKPLCCGDREDAEALLAASDGAGVTLNEVNPVWLRTPAAPLVAAMVENRVLDLALVRETAAKLRERFEAVVMEGAGGWLVPIENGYFMADLAAEMGWPVLVVAANRLGALNHTLLTVEAIRRRGMRCQGVVLNQAQPVAGEGSVAAVTNRGILESCLDLPVWEIGHHAPFAASVSWRDLLPDVSGV